MKGTTPGCGRLVRRGLTVVVAMVALVSSVRAQVTTTQELIDAVESAGAGEVVHIGAEEFVLTEPLQPSSGVALIGAGAGETVIRAASSWNPGTGDLPDNETDFSSANQNAYLINLGTGTTGITIANLTLTGPTLHGAILGNDCDTLEVYNVHICDFLWSGIRTWRMNDVKIHDNEFVDAGGKYGGRTGGGVFMTWAKRSEFWNNRIYKTPDFSRNFYGFKGKQVRNSRVHHNDVLVNFSLEFAHENDHYVEIDHNHFTGTISIPKHAGGSIPDGGYTFHIHHNWLQSSYQLEWARNGAEVDHNLFDFDGEKDKGNLISEFGQVAYEGPTDFHDNLIKNPGRGVFWGRAPIGNYSFYNNHVIANKTVTPRTDGLFGFNTGSDFSTITIKDNIFECHDLDRPLVRNDESYGATIENNTFVGIADADRIDNPQTGDVKGPKEPLKFYVGVDDEYLVDGWEVTKASVEAVRPVHPVKRYGTGVKSGTPAAIGTYTLRGRRMYGGGRESDPVKLRAAQPMVSGTHGLRLGTEPMRE
jgi:nitrous oxidase accessory protein